MPSLRQIRKTLEVVAILVGPAILAITHIKGDRKDTNKVPDSTEE